MNELYPCIISIFYSEQQDKDSNAEERNNDNIEVRKVQGVKLL